MNSAKKGLFVECTNKSMIGVTCFVFYAVAYALGACFRTHSMV